MGSPRTNKRRERRERAKRLAAHGLEMCEVKPGIWRPLPKSTNYAIEVVLTKRGDMSLSKDIRKYSADWAELAERIANEAQVIIPTPSVAVAKTIRFKFYGFRDALALHDPNNPWLSAILSVNITCPDNPPRIIFGRGSALDVLMAGLRATKKPPEPPESTETEQRQPPSPGSGPQSAPPPTSAHDDVLLSLGYGVKNDKDGESK